ncbi:MAG: thermostable hemolysin [Parvibaculum sp.]
MKLTLIDRDSTERPAVEAFLRDGYARAYDANPDAFPATLCAVFGAGGTPLSAAGFREARDGFFSESYLDRPLEAAASAALGRAMTRHEFMEVTTLVSASPFALFPLMAGMLALGRDRGLGCGVFTATGQLRGLFTRLGVPFVPVAPARPERIEQPERWGSYYAMDPWVCLMPNPEAAPSALFPRSCPTSLCAEEQDRHG